MYSDTKDRFGDYYQNILKRIRYNLIMFNL